MGWTKHDDAVKLHVKELKRSHKEMRRILSGVAKLSPARAIEAWDDLRTFTKLKHALAGTKHVRDLDEIDIAKIMRLIGKKCGPVNIRVTLC